MKNLAKGFTFGFTWFVLIWLGMFINTFLFPINQCGVHPRDISIMGLVRIFLHPFLHGSLDHILSNSIPLFVLTTTLMANYQKLAGKVMFLSIFIGGSLLWICGRGDAVHIGASGLIFSLIGFLFFNMFFRKDWKSLITAILIGFLYGGLIFGIFPSDPHVSWEGHLCGFATGIYLAYLLRKDPSD